MARWAIVASYAPLFTASEYLRWSLVSSWRREIEHYQRAAGRCTRSNGVVLDMMRVYRLAPNLG